MIPLSQPDITKYEINSVNKTLASNFLSGGPMLKEFETKLAAVAGTKYAVAVGSGTAALHLILLSLGIKPGDEVITTPFSFIASANCILYVGATPVFCDIAPDDLNIDPELIESKITPRTKAILVVHVFGFPARMDKICSIAAKYDLQVIEDACEAIGAKWDEKSAGGIGTAGAFAFYPNKQITTGEGGAVVTDDPAIAKSVRSLANQGREPGDHWLCHERLGYNYRLDELSAAIGVAQLERLPEILTSRSRVAGWYEQELRQELLVATPKPYYPNKVAISWFVYVIRFCDPNLREIAAEHLEKLGIETRPYFPAIHLQPVYRQMFGYTEGSFPVTETVASTTLALPFFTRLTNYQVKEVCNGLKSALRLPETVLRIYAQ
jgi:Predicted pyridoxal phosphate-dependent enzyme apparently involved in regulation of cell wall biogenesis